ncbi:RICIN domain-containing protein [Kribbella sp. VKM Ac-2568]|uniref:RICIN domain-containing protein n=1 Tax=Kribbella sp. VKM Ac-2568 TaxID=2512219 RepID=UPI001043D0CC|nr:RICIN domain-containing protein [Kribbella sp. VKM Ac-2568]TCM51543.1 ricin-type beta-trefoil lectin protein [Kribbella sp. VKM Ac-2568]
MLSDRKIPITRLLALLVLACLCLTSGSAFAREARPDSQNAVAANFNVLAFYSGTWDAAHIDFEKEANQRFPQFGAQNGFTYTATTNWDQLNNLTASQYQVVMFLDDSPHSAAQKAGFQRYMENGGAFFGFHVSAYNDASGNWPWFNNTFLATGRFATNTWGPTAVTLKAENRSHPSLVNTGATFRSSVSEWYSWQNDLRNNPDIQILASIDPSSFPVGTDPAQTWRSGYYPIVWTNKNFKMIYANFGHNAMNYETNTRLSSTFDSPAQNQFMMDALKWLGGGGGTVPPVDQPSPTAWYSVANKGNNKCVDARAAGTANGTVIQQYSCNSSQAQHFQFQPTSDGFTRVNNRNDATKVIDVTGVSAADNAGLQLWTYSNGANQQWRAVSEGGGYFHFVSRLSNKCLTVPGGSTADSTQLVQLTCNNSAAQSFKLTAA